MKVPLKVGCLPSAVGKQPFDPCLHARMLDVSYLCVSLCDVGVTDVFKYSKFL